MLIYLLTFSRVTVANQSIDTPLSTKTVIVGGGIIGALEAYYAYQAAQRADTKIGITIYEKGSSLDSGGGQSSTNTAYNIVPSLTIDEILSVVPCGTELVDKLAILFSQPVLNHAMYFVQEKP